MRRNSKVILNLFQDLKERCRNIQRMSLNGMTRVWLASLMLLSLCSCASYKSTWDCPKVRGIGCSSIEYADQVAREQILASKSYYNRHGERIARGHPEKLDHHGTSSLVMTECNDSQECNNEEK